MNSHCTDTLGTEWCAVNLECLGQEGYRKGGGLWWCPVSKARRLALRPTSVCSVDGEVMWGGFCVAPGARPVPDTILEHIFDGPCTYHMLS